MSGRTGRGGPARRGRRRAVAARGAGRAATALRLAGVVGQAALLILAACGRLDEPAGGQLAPAAQPFGVLSGSIVLPSAGPATAAAADPSPAAAAVVPGELIVAFDGRPTHPPTALDTPAGKAQHLRPLALPGVELYRIPGLEAAATRAAAVALTRRPGVRFAQPNALRFPVAAPNDPHGAVQWALPALHLPEAWELETGSSTTVVAVVDTGILYRQGDAAASHPDLSGRVLPGYDFISDAARANDGDGRDPDPYDAGDEISGQASYHGTHVASIIGAVTDNGVGMSGVDWAARLLPVRVLGVGGGTVADTVDGMLWAVGEPVPQLPDNPSPANVVNLSLGGAGACSAAEQAAIDAARAAGAVVVAAAGNEDADAAGAAPANCAGVIVVGATDAGDARAWYSNYGAAIDVMAPGGDTSADLNGDAFLDGILGAHRDDASGTFDYVFYQGTSMAAPHVSGIVALAHARNPALGPAELEGLLEDTARPLDAAACGVTRAGAAACGAGLVDARAALLEAPGYTLPPADVSFDPPSLDFGDANSLVGLTLSNVGGGGLDWSFRDSEPDPGNPAPLPPDVVGIGKGSPSSGVLQAGQSVATSFTLERGSVPAAGSYQLSLVFDTSAGVKRLPASFRQPLAAPGALTGPSRVVAWQQAGRGKRLLTGLDGSDQPVPSFTLIAAAGETHLFVWIDDNHNDRIDAGDGFAALAAPVNVAPGSVTTGLVLTVQRVTDEPVALESLPLPP